MFLGQSEVGISTNSVDALKLKDKHKYRLVVKHNANEGLYTCVNCGLNYWEDKVFNENTKYYWGNPRWKIATPYEIVFCEGITKGIFNKL